MKILFEILIIFLASLNLLLGWRAIYRLHQPTNIFYWSMKVMISGISPVLFLVGILLVVVGVIINSIPAIAISGLSALIFLIHIISTIHQPEDISDFESAFGEDWNANIPLQLKKIFLRKRYVFVLPKWPTPIFNQNISFYKIRGTDRELLCDVWQPPKNVEHSGVAFIYLHGSAWAVLDKDFGTRKFFQHLANQGHVIMDVAYRLFPETDMMGMVHDAKHAIAWMKDNAAVYCIDPERIVIGGGSAGAHIALLAAYTNLNDRFIPEDLAAADLKVHGVISLYGQSDLVATYYHTCQQLAKHSSLSQKKKGEQGGLPTWLQKKMGKNFHRLGFDKNVEPGMLAPMFGGTPDKNPEPYTIFSPITHADSFSPPTLIIHGEQDILAPVFAIRQLYYKLKKAGVPAVMHILPQTDHAFDLIFPKISPSAQNAIYDVERFLAVMSANQVIRLKWLKSFSSSLV